MSGWRWALALILIGPVVGCATFEATRRGDDLIEAGQYEAAITLYKSALANKSSERLRAKLGEAESLYSQHLATAAEAELVAGNAQQAFEMLVTALELDPDNDAALDLLDRARDACLRDAAAWERRAQPAEAMALYGLILTQYKRHDQARAGYERTLERQAENLYLSGKREEETHPASALAGYLAAEALSPGYRDAIDRALALRERLLADAQTPMTVSVTRSKGVRVDPRPWRGEIQSAVNERAWPVTVQSKATSEVGALRLKVHIAALTAKVSHKIRPVTESVEVIHNKRPNPAHAPAKAAADAAQAKAQTARADAHEAEALWIDARERLHASPGSGRAIEAEEEAKAEHDRARGRLALAQAQADEALATLEQTPPFLGDVQTVSATFNVTEAGIVERLSLDGSCQVLGDAPVEVPIQLAVDRTRKDTGAEAVPSLGRPADPLDIPLGSNPRGPLIAMAKQAVIDGALACREAQIADSWAQARRLSEQGWHDAAADAMLAAWLSAPRQGKGEALGYLVEALGAPEDLLEALFAEIPAGSEAEAR